MTDIYQRRLNALRQKIRETNTDLVAIGPSNHLNWLTGINAHGDERPIFLLVTQTYAGFLMPSLNGDSVRQHTALPFHIWSDADGPTNALQNLLDSCGLNTGDLRMVLDETHAGRFRLLLTDALPRAATRFTQDTVGLLRKSKDETEYQALKASNSINDLAITAAFDGLTEGMSERDVADIIAGVYKANKAEVEFIAVAFGGNGAFAHHHTGDTKLVLNSAVQN